MIEFHLIVAKSDYSDIESLVKKDKFEILASYSTRNGNGRLFVISSESEDMTALTLKYGPENVWKR